MSDNKSPKNYAWGLALVLPPLIDPMPPLCHPKNYFLDPPLVSAHAAVFDLQRLLRIMSTKKILPDV